MCFWNLSVLISFVQLFDGSVDLSFRIAFASNCLAAFNFDVCCFPNAQSCVSLPPTVTHKVQVSSPNVLQWKRRSSVDYFPDYQLHGICLLKSVCEKF